MSMTDPHALTDDARVARVAALAAAARETTAELIAHLVEANFSPIRGAMAAS